MKAQNRYGWSSPSPIYVFQTADHSEEGKYKTTQHDTKYNYRPSQCVLQLIQRGDSFCMMKVGDDCNILTNI